MDPIPFPPELLDFMRTGFLVCLSLTTLVLGTKYCISLLEAERTSMEKLALHAIPRVGAKTKKGRSLESLRTKLPPHLGDLEPSFKSLRIRFRVALPLAAILTIFNPICFLKLWLTGEIREMPMPFAISMALGWLAGVVGSAGTVWPMYRRLRLYTRPIYLTQNKILALPTPDDDNWHFANDACVNGQFSILGENAVYEDIEIPGVPKGYADEVRLCTQRRAKKLALEAAEDRFVGLDKRGAS